MKKVRMEKKLIEVEVPVFEDNLGGFESLIGKNIVVWAGVYIYSGRLAGINDGDILLEDACVVYETGELTGKSFKDAQRLPNRLYVRKAAIECYYERGF